MGGISFHAAINGPALAGWTALRVPENRLESLLYVSEGLGLLRRYKRLWTPDCRARENIRSCPRLPLGGVRAALPVGHPPGCPALRSRDAAVQASRGDLARTGGRGLISELSRPPCPVPAPRASSDGH